MIADDARRFEQIVARLRRQDLNFAARFDGSRQLSAGWTVTFCVALWLTAPVMIAVGGWTGLLVAVVACGYSFPRYRRARTSRHQPGSP